MRTVHLDFLHTSAPPALPGWIMLTVGVLSLLAVLGWHYATAIAVTPRIADGEKRLAVFRKILENRKQLPVRVEQHQVAEEWGRAMRVAWDLNHPWSGLFATFENESQRPVALLAFESDAVRRELALTAEARNFDEMLAFVRLLQNSRVLSGVTLHTHRVNQQDKEKPIRFRVTASWMEAS